MNWKWNSSRWLLLLVMLLLAACASGDEGDGISLFGAQPTQLDSSSAESIFTTFMDAWERQDYTTMYSLISPNARDQFSFETFTSIYEDDFRLPIGLREIDWTLVSGPLVQGTSASVNYRVDFVSDVLGEFSDPAPELEATEPRVMYLVAIQNEGWRVAWSRMDIFNGWASNASLRVQRDMPTRGNIYDRNGEILVSQNGRVVGIWVIENQMRNVEQCRNELARILRKERAEIQELFDTLNNDSLFLAGEVPEDVANRENSTLSNFCNHDPIPRSTRQYYGNVAPHVIGYIGRIPEAESNGYAARGYPADALVGLDGLERAFEDELRGTIGKRLQIVSNTGIPIRTITSVDLEAGQSLYLTIDRNLQLGIQQMLAEAYTDAIPTWSTTSDGAAVVVLEVNTGNVLAIASYPDYDPSVYNPDSAFNSSIGNTAIQQIQDWQNDTRDPLLNRATSGRYPLGSVMKVFSMVAGLDSGAWGPNNVVTCTGSWNGAPFNDILRNDWNPDGHGALDMAGGLINSCNPYFWQMSTAIYDNAGPDVLPSYLQRFGFGSSPSMQGVSTDPGLIEDPEYVLRVDERSWSYSDNINMVIGQGDVQVNPLQVALATAAVANGGFLHDPYIVQRVVAVGQSTPTYQAVPTGENLGINPDVLRQTRDAMCAVTRYTAQHAGTAAFIFDLGWYEQNGYQILVCGKTGTAQTPRLQPHAWFNAFAPAEAPEIAVAVIVENSCEGSEVAAPMTRRIMEMYYPSLFTDGYDWPEPIWTGFCTEIGPGSTG